MGKLPENVFAEEKLKREARKISVKEGSAYSFMDGFGLRYITPYAISLGSNNFHIGLLSSLPSLLGNLSQLYTLKAMNKYSRKKLVFSGVLLQSIMWLFIIGIGVLYFILGINGNKIPWLLIAFYTLLIMFGAFSGPAWASWMKDIVTEKRGDYFGNRNKIVGSITIICMLLAGFILDYFKQTYLFLGYIIIFTIAFLGRFVSAMYFLKQYEPEFKPDNKAYFTLFQFIKKMAFNNFGRFVIFYSLMMLAVNIAAPFFAVYLLKDLGFSYVSYMAIILSSAISSLIFMPIWGKFSDLFGTIKTIRMTSRFIPLIPFLWALSFYIFSYNSNFIIPYLIIIEIFSGIIWAGFNLAAGNFIYDAVSRERMAICTSYFNIISGVGMILGALIGGFIASHEIVILQLNQILWVFIISGIVRYLIYASMAKKIEEVREVMYFKGDKVKKKLTNLTLKELKIKELKNSIEDISKTRFLEVPDTNLFKR